jgi:MFS transporter, PPP family, 3-phenylpropionic acid transporter
MPYWRLSSFYWIYYAILGAMVPFWARYFTLKGFTIVEIGSILAAVSAARVIGPNTWAWIADKSEARIFLYRAATVIGAFCFGGMVLAETYWLMLLSVFSFAFCWGAVMPQFETITMAHLTGNESKYTLTRLWGSIGYICLSISMGTMIDYYAKTGFSVLLLTLFVIAIGISFSIPVSSNLENKPAANLKLSQLFFKPAVVYFFCAGLLMQMSHAPFYTYFDMYLTANGYSGTDSGVYISIGVVAEIIAFLFMPKLIKRYGIKNLLLFCAFCGILRWILTAVYVENPMILLFAQVLHGATFGIAHAASIYWITQIFTGAFKSRGQALYTSLTYGLGGVIGNLVFAQVWLLPNGKSSVFIGAALCCMFASMIILFFIPRLKELQGAR